MEAHGWKRAQKRTERLVIGSHQHRIEFSSLTSFPLFTSVFNRIVRAVVVTVFFVASNLISAPGSKQPNFIVILGEGAGWTSSSVQMDDRNPASKGDGVKTPNLERLAVAGMRFSDGYAASPRCTPSRAALFTGKSPAQLHMTFIGVAKRNDAVTTKVIPPTALLELPEVEITVGEFLKRAGYATAHFGKWHVGRVNPIRHGFDESDGPTNNGGPDEVATPNPKQAIAMTAKGIDFMERQVKAGRPFYLQMSHYPNQEEKGAGGGGDRNRRIEAAREEIKTGDKTIGEILDAIERLGLKSNTYIVYTTDHGTQGPNRPLTGSKGTVWEGGIRVPFIVAGPGIKAGICSHVRVSAMDLFPTFADLAGIKEPLPKGVEGGSFSSVLKNGGGGTVRRPRQEFVVHFPHYDKKEGPASALLLGDFKLIRFYETAVFQLFNIAKDPGERHDLAKEMPEKSRELNQRLTDYFVEVNAQLPKPNPNFDPTKKIERKGFQRE